MIATFFSKNSWITRISGALTIFMLLAPMLTPLSIAVAQEAEPNDPAVTEQTSPEDLSADDIDETQKTAEDEDINADLADDASKNENEEPVLKFLQAQLLEEEASCDLPITVTTSTNESPVLLPDSIILLQSTQEPCSYGVGHWEQVSIAGGSPVIDTPHTAWTSISNLTVPGMYTYKMVIHDYNHETGEWDGPIVGEDEVSFEVKGICNVPITATATTDQSPVLLPDSTILLQSTQEPCSRGVGHWEQVSIPGGAPVIDTPHTAWTSISNLTVPGTYTYKMVIHDYNHESGEWDGPILDEDEVTFEVVDESSPQLAAVQICKVDENQNPLPGWTLMLKGDHIEDLSVPTNISSGIDTINPLVAGVSYIAKAVGTWLNQGTANPADAEYSTTDGWATHMDGYTGYQSDILELQIDQTFDPNSNWGAYNSAHTYAQSFVPTTTSANFRIFDGSGTVQNEGWFEDNSGTLSVSLNKGYSGITGTNGCVSFTDVPYGTYTIDELMQDGWENVSGLGEKVIDQSVETFTVVNSLEDNGNENTENTIVVKATNLAANLGDVLSDSTKWFFYNDETDAIDNLIGSFVNGPGTAPEGDGSAQMSVIGSQRRNLATYQFKDIKLSDITTLNFSTYAQSIGDGSLGTERAPYLHFNVDFNNSDAWQRRLVYVPGTNGAVTADTWQTWDALGGGNAKWVYSGATWPTTSESESGVPGTTAKTWSEILVDYPNAETRSTDSWFGFRVGEPYADGFTGNVDKFVIGIDTGSGIDTTTFDFEPTPVVSLPACSDDIDNDNDDLVDMADSGCSDLNDTDESNPVPTISISSNSRGGGSSGSAPKKVLGTSTSITTDSAGEVLGATACGAYLTGYIKLGENNDKENVSRLQTFLNEYLGLTLAVDGIFGKNSFNAVKQFQLKEKDHVLKPWMGVTLATDEQGTGWVYKTTVHKINMIKCPELNLPTPEAKID